MFTINRTAYSKFLLLSVLSVITLVAMLSYPSWSFLVFLLFIFYFELFDGNYLRYSVSIIVNIFIAVTIIVFNFFFFYNIPLYLLTSLYFSFLLCFEIVAIKLLLKYKYCLLYIFLFSVIYRLLFYNSDYLFPFYWTLSMQLHYFSNYFSLLVIPLLFEGLCVSCCSFVYKVYSRAHKASHVFQLLIIVFASVALTGVYRSNKPAVNTGLECTVVQGGFSALDYQLFDKYPAIKEKLTKQYLSYVEQNHNADLIIIPESAFPFAHNAESALVKQLGEIAVKNNSNIYASFIYREEENEFSSVALINKEGTIAGRYSKNNPVYFFESELIERSNDNTCFTVEGTTIAPLICFDVVFLKNLNDRSNDVDLYIVTSNDVFAENTVLAKLHKAYAVINARNLGKPLLQVVQNGPSFYVDSRGRVSGITQKYEEVTGKKITVK